MDGGGGRGGGGSGCRVVEGAAGASSQAFNAGPTANGDVLYPSGSIYTTIMELGPQNHTGHGLVVPNSIGP